jgi:hypothetical protein
MGTKEDQMIKYVTEKMVNKLSFLLKLNLEQDPS